MDEGQEHSPGLPDPPLPSQKPHQQKTNQQSGRYRAEQGLCCNKGQVTADKLQPNSSVITAYLGITWVGKHQCGSQNSSQCGSKGDWQSLPLFQKRISSVSDSSQAHQDSNRFHKETAAQADQKAHNRNRTFLREQCQQNQNTCHGQEVVDKGRTPGVDLLPKPSGCQRNQGKGQGKALPFSFPIRGEALSQQKGHPGQHAPHKQSPQPPERGKIQLSLQNADEIAQIPPISRNSICVHILWNGMGKQKILE